jgi:hypothetical protein
MTEMPRLFTILLVPALLLGSARPALAQESLSGVLSFLLVNRSIPTGDFARDAQAAAAMRDAVIGLLQAEISTVPLSSPASGFTYRLDPELGIHVRASDSFGPFFLERSLTSGARQMSVGVGFTQADFVDIDGRSLRNGTLVATASQFAGEPVPFDAETLTLRVRTRTATMSATAGLTDRLDVSAMVPFVRVSFSGERLDIYRGTPYLQASAVAASSGVGDVALRAKYNVWRQGASGVAVAGEVRLPTGDKENLLGTGSTVITPRVIGSYEPRAWGVHGSFGVAFGGPSTTVDYGGAVTLSATPRLTLVGEFLGRRINEGGRLIDVIEPHPTLIDVQTLRLSATSESTTRSLFSVGFRWNVAGRGLISGNVLRPVSTAGLNARWLASITFDYSLGG